MKDPRDAPFYSTLTVLRLDRDVVESVWWFKTGTVTFRCLQLFTEPEAERFVGRTARVLFTMDVGEGRFAEGERARLTVVSSAPYFSDSDYVEVVGPYQRIRCRDDGGDDSNYDPDDDDGVQLIMGPAPIAIFGSHRSLICLPGAQPGQTVCLRGHPLVLDMVLPASPLEGVDAAT